MLNDDYKDMLRALSNENVEFILVGAYAMASHGYPRATMDMDIWVAPTPENAEAVIRALEEFGAPLERLTREDLVKDDIVFQIGIAPNRIDILTGASGLTFKQSYEASKVVNIDGVNVHVLSIEHLIENKRATGRTRDQADVQALEFLKRHL